MTRPSPPGWRKRRQEAAAGRQSARDNPEPPAVAQTPRKPLHSSWWARATKLILERDRYICHACRAMGCEATGADSADHHPVPRSECEAAGISLYALTNLRAIHGKQPCAHCGVNCNRLKGAGSMAAFRLKWERRTGNTAKPLPEPLPERPWLL